MNCPTYAEDRARVEQRIKQINRILEDDDDAYEGLKEERERLKDRLETMKEHEDLYEWPPGEQ